MSVPGFFALVVAAGSAVTPVGKDFYATNAVGFSSPRDWEDQLEEIELEIDLGDGVAGEIAIGHRLNNWRLEASYGLNYSSWKSMKVTSSTSEAEAKIGMKGRINVQTFLLSSFYNFENQSKFSPYVGGGLGLSQLGSPKVTMTHGGDSYTSSMNGLALSGQLTAGVTYKLDQTNDIYLEGGLLQLFPMGDEDISIDPLRFAGVKIGTRWRF